MVIVQSRTGKTEDAYQRRAGKIIRRLDRDIQTAHQRQWTLDDLPGHLENLMPSVVYATWRQYKANSLCPYLYLSIYLYRDG
jgi:hypothetical protein